LKPKRLENRELVGIEGRVVSGVFNLESSDTLATQPIDQLIDLAA
jgi:hypothetical protein